MKSIIQSFLSTAHPPNYSRKYGSLGTSLYTIGIRDGVNPGVLDVVENNPYSFIDVVINFDLAFLTETSGAWQAILWNGTGTFSPSA